MSGDRLGGLGSAEGGAPPARVWDEPDWRDRSVAVVGLGLRTNVPLVRYLVRRGARVTALERKSRDELGEALRLLDGLPFELRTGPDHLEAIDAFDIIALTPGVKMTEPAIQRAIQRGARLTSEMQLFTSLCPGRIVGVTGSAGKTTTTSLIHCALEAAGRRVWLAGNIGLSLIERLDEIGPDDWVVIELSSFQLELVERGPDVAVVTNIRPNHLDVHPSFDAYVAAKRRILSTQPETGLAVLNADDPTTRQLVAAAPGPSVAWFSRQGEVEVGAFLRDGRIVWRDGLSEVEVLEVDGLRLVGRHNVENALAAVAACLLTGADPEPVARAIATFPGVEHRLELVQVVGGVRYINDSIASSPDRTLAALEAVPGPIHLILGGSDKRLSFDELAQAITRHDVRTALLIGQTAGQIEAALERARRGEDPEVVRAGRLSEAVREAAARARPGDAVLLSPACASFDQFRDFADRGRQFRALVEALGDPS